LKIDDLVIDYNDGIGPQLAGAIAERLYAIKRGKNYTKAQEREELFVIAKDLQSMASDCLVIARMSSKNTILARLQDELTAADVAKAESFENYQAVGNTSRMEVGVAYTAFLACCRLRDTALENHRAELNNQKGNTDD